MQYSTALQNLSHVAAPTSPLLAGRELEEQLLEYAVTVARRKNLQATDQAQAHALMAGAMMLGHRYPAAAQAWRESSESYFASHPQERLPASEWVQRGWLLGFARWRDALERSIIQAQLAA